MRGTLSRAYSIDRSASNGDGVEAGAQSRSTILGLLKYIQGPCSKLSHHDTVSGSARILTAFGLKLTAAKVDSMKKVLVL